MEYPCRRRILQTEQVRQAIRSCACAPRRVQAGKNHCRARPVDLATYVQTAGRTQVGVRSVATPVETAGDCEALSGPVRATLPGQNSRRFRQIPRRIRSVRAGNGRTAGQPGDRPYPLSKGQRPTAARLFSSMSAMTIRSSTPTGMVSLSHAS